MTLEEVNNLITTLSTQIPALQTQLQQALGYKQALIDLKEEEDKKETKNKK